MGLFYNYLLYQLTARYIGCIAGHGASELLPGTYLYIFQTQKSSNLEILLEDVRSLNDEYEVKSMNSILDLALKYGEQHELRSEERTYELSGIEKHLEKRQGFEVFSDTEPSRSGEALLYFFPRRVTKLKKLLPPNLGQLEQ